MGLRREAYVAEFVDLVMGMRRGPSRVAPHNALWADPPTGFTFSVQLFLVLGTSNVGSRVYRNRICSFLYFCAPHHLICDTDYIVTKSWMISVYYKTNKSFADTAIWLRI